MGDSISGVGQKLMPATIAVAGLGTAAVKTAADFDAGMSKVAAISGATGDDLQALRDKAREMGAKTKFSASEAASAMEYMAMAGWKTTDMLGGIEGVMNLAAASGADLATTSDIVTDALTAFGLSAADSGHFADILAAASSNANTNVQMMGETFKYCAPIAGALGFSAEDTAQAIGLMANAGIKSTQAGTALRTIMNNLTGEVKLSGAALGEVTIATTNADGSMRNLSDILGDCRDAFSQLSESEKAQAAESLVGKNAMSGFLALMNASEADVNKLSSAIANCDGVAENMAMTMQDNLAGQLTILKSQLEELAISFGEMLMPAIRNIVSKIQAFVDKLNHMSEGQRKAVLTTALLAAAIGPLLVIIGTIISKVGVAMQGFVKLAKGMKKLQLAAQTGTGVVGKLATAISGISAPVIAVVAVIAVLAAAFKHLWDTNEGFRNAITAIWDGIVSKISAFCQGIVDRLNALGFSFSSIIDVLKEVWDGFCNFLAPVFETAFSVVSSILGTVLDVITGLLDVFIGLFTGNWEQLWTGVKEIAEGIWNGISNFISTILGVIHSVFSTVWNAIKGTVTTVLNAISTFITNIFNGIKTTATTIWNAIKTAISTVVDGIRSKISSVFESVKSTVSSIFEGIRSTAVSVWNGIKSAITTPIEAARDKVKSVVDAIKGFFSGLKLELPHIKLPHFKVSGTLSISPPSVPHLSIDWYKKGGIMTRPTIFGMNGSSLMAGGEAGREAILPLSGFYKQLEAMLTEKMNMHNVEKYLAVIAANSGKGIYLDDGTLVGRLLPAIDNGLGQQQKLNARLSL